MRVVSSRCSLVIVRRTVFVPLIVWIMVERGWVTVVVDAGKVVVRRTVLVTTEVAVVVIVFVGAAKLLAASSKAKSVKRMVLIDCA